MSTSHTDIESWQLHSDAGGENRQQQLTSTEKNPREDLPAITDLRSSSEIASNMPVQASRARVQLARETPRVTKRNVLPGYDSDLETYTAETVETTVPRLPTHEPCVEHVPARFEPAVDLEQRLQQLLADSNPESEDYVQYRNSEGGTRFAVQTGLLEQRNLSGFLPDFLSRR